MASGCAGMFIDKLLKCHILGKTSHFLALLVEISFENKKNIICGILYR